MTVDATSDRATPLTLQFSCAGDENLSYRVACRYHRICQFEERIHFIFTTMMMRFIMWIRQLALKRLPI